MQFLYMEVSENVSFPKSSKFSIENHGFGDPSFRTPFLDDFWKSQNISGWYIVIEIDPFMKSLPILDLLIQEFYNVGPPNMMFVGF
jgi:hypothetical protein